MPRLTRRDFLRSAFVAAGGLAVDHLLAACGQKNNTDLNQFSPATSTATSPQPTPSPLSSVEASTPTNPASLPAVSVAHGTEPEQMVRQAIAALGGIERFVPKGAYVIVKPNICVAYHPYQYAATTNPWVVGALVRLCLEAGARRVQVMDYPFGGSPEEAYERSGIAEQVRAAGGDMITMPNFMYKVTPIPQGRDLKQISVFEDVLKADVLIDVPIAKHHGLARLTLGMKNLMGIILERGDIHHNLGQRIADLTSLLRPHLTVVDAVRILMDNGPTGGDLNDVKQTNTVIASPDIVAADSYAATLFDLRPGEIDYISAATVMGLGRMDIQNLKIEEISVGS
jgi:uncharacterized protein (DUF362 family)